MWSCYGFQSPAHTAWGGIHSQMFPSGEGCHRKDVLFSVGLILSLSSGISLSPRLWKEQPAEMLLIPSLSCGEPLAPTAYVGR